MLIVENERLSNSLANATFDSNDVISYLKKQVEDEDAEVSGKKRLKGKGQGTSGGCPLTGQSTFVSEGNEQGISSNNSCSIIGGCLFTAGARQRRKVVGPRGPADIDPPGPCCSPSSIQKWKTSEVRRGGACWKEGELSKKTRQQIDSRGEELT